MLYKVGSGKSVNWASSEAGGVSPRLMEMLKNDWGQGPLDLITSDSFIKAFIILDFMTQDTHNARLAYQILEWMHCWRYNILRKYSNLDPESLAGDYSIGLGIRECDEKIRVTTCNPELGARDLGGLLPNIRAELSRRYPTA